jgi:hypothetical protein
MAEAVSAVAMADSARDVKQVRTVVWVMSLARVGLLVDGYDLVGSMTPIIPSTPLDDIYSKKTSRGECSIAALFPIVAPTRPAGAN